MHPAALIHSLTPRIDNFLGLFDMFEPFQAPTVDGDGRAVIDIRGVIGIHADADEIIPVLRQVDASVFEVHLDSGGGNAWQGVAISNFLRQHKARVEIHVDAVAASAASVIAMAGDEVIMHPGSMMMVHNGRATVDGGTAEDLRDLAVLLDKVNVSMAGIYATHAGGDADAWLATMAAETWFTADEAVAAGLASSVPSSDSGTGASRDSAAPASSVSGAAATFAGIDLAEVFGYKYNGRDDAPDPGTTVAAEVVDTAGNSLFQLVVGTSTGNETVATWHTVTTNTTADPDADDNPDAADLSAVFAKDSTPDAEELAAVFTPNPSAPADAIMKEAG